MPTIDGVEFDTGSLISFKTKNAYDSNLYKGAVTAICKYNIAKAFNNTNMDIDAYHVNVAKTDNDIDPVTDMNFFIVDTETEKNVPIAFEWVEPGSFKLVSFSDTVTIKIFDINAVTETEIIQKLLTDNGYRNRVI